jgi:hypothetical protein
LNYRRFFLVFSLADAVVDPLEESEEIESQSIQRRGDAPMRRLSLAALVVACASTPSLADGASPSELARRAIERRAVEAVIWGMPAVNTELMADQMMKAGGRPGQIIYWGKPLDWHNQTLTPNPDTLYFMGFYDLKASGPMVVEIPPAGDDGSLNGNFVTLWQTALEDAGPLGIDKGKGVKFVITPPAIPGRFRRASNSSHRTPMAASSSFALASKVTATPTCRHRSLTASG